MSKQTYTRDQLSNYDGFKKLDQLQEKIAEGKLKPPREPQRDYLCARCSRRKRSTQIVPTLTAGERLEDTPFKGKFIVCCAECAAELHRAGVPQAAAEQAERMKRMGLVMP